MENHEHDSMTENEERTKHTEQMEIKRQFSIKMRPMEKCAESQLA